jgi:transformation/transcription domain-associated protein
MSKQVNVFTSLMQALSKHLRPAPCTYFKRTLWLCFCLLLQLTQFSPSDPYGLLTLRLLGKLGGKNRLFLREPLSLPSSTVNSDDTFAFHCKWHSTGGESAKAHPFYISVQISRCVELLKGIVLGASTKPLKKESTEKLRESSLAIRWKDRSSLWKCQLENVDYDAYARDVMNETRTDQAAACVQVIAAVVSKLEVVPRTPSNPSEPIHKTRLLDLEQLETEKKVESALLGLLFGTMIESSKVNAWLALERMLRTIYPVWAASTLTKFLASSNSEVVKSGASIIQGIVEEESYFQESRREEFLFSLVSNLSDASSIGPWKERLGAQKVLLLVLKALGRNWAEAYEFRLMSAAFLSVKTIPRELSLASVESLRFFVELCSLLYEIPLFLNVSDSWYLDPLSQYPTKRESEGTEGALPANDVIKLVLQELGSTKQMSRYVSQCVSLCIHLRLLIVALLQVCCPTLCVQHYCPTCNRFVPK